MNLIDSLVALYAPHSCVACGLEGLLLCDMCSASLSTLPDRCYRCGTTSRGCRTCVKCRQETALNSVNAMTIYEDSAKELISKLKFGRALAAGERIGRLMADAYGDRIGDGVLVVRFLRPVSASEAVDTTRPRSLHAPSLHIRKPAMRPS